MQWEARRVKFIARFAYGVSLASDNRDEGRIPVFGSNGIVGFHSQANTDAPCIIIGRKGSYGKVNFSESRCFAIDTTYYIDSSITSNDIRFLYYAIPLLKLDETSQDSAVPGLSREYAYNLRLPLPPLPEQRAIAAYLDRAAARIDALIAKKQRLLELLHEKRQALISQAVTKGLNPDVPMKETGIPWLGEVPAHWSIQRLKTLTPFITSGSRWWAQYYSDVGAIFLRIGNLSRDGIDLRLTDIQFVRPPEGAEMERTRVEPGDVLISITAYIGSIGVINDDIGEAYINQHIALTRPFRYKVYSRWLAYSLLSEVGQRQFRLFLYGGTKDGLGLDDVKNIQVLLPPLEEQLTIANYLDSQLGKLEEAQRKVEIAIERLREYRAALISAAVTGKIDLRQEDGL